MTPEFEHELTTGVPADFPDGLCAKAEAAADGDRVIMDREDNNVRVAAADDEALRWLIGYLDDTGSDHARQVADAIESTFLDGDNARHRNPPKYYGVEAAPGIEGDQDEV